MTKWLRRWWNVYAGHRPAPKGCPYRPALESLETRCLLTAGGYLQTNLVSDIPGLAQITDSHLHNPWGVSFSATSPFWVSNQGTNTSTLYSVTPTGVTTQATLVVAIPTTPAGPQGPTGQVQNNTMSFLVGTNPASFIFADLNGTISAWNGSAGTTAQVEATVPGAVFTGLAIGSNSSGNFLYAANDAQGRIDVFDGSFAHVDLGANAFVDPSLPAGLVPFNIQNIGGNLYVAYAPAGRAGQVNAQEGDGAVAVFDTMGNFQGQLITGSKLAAPWGIALAPAGFGRFGGDLLVGNFAYNFSEINAFDPTTGALRGTLTDLGGHTILNQALWTIAFGRGGSNGDPNTLYFAAGINGEMDGLFGSIQAVPSISPRAPIVTNLDNAPEQTFSTVPANGDLNPYGVAIVPPDFQAAGQLHPGDILVSNFNNSDNLQGTGTTIVRIAPTGEHSVFFQGPEGLGLTTALGILPNGFVIVGNVPTDDGTFDTIHQGSLLILDSSGQLVETLANQHLLDGPWDLTIHREEDNRAQVFVSNVLSGTVTRIDLMLPRNAPPVVVGMTQIASGYKHEENDTALVVGPTGLAFDAERDLLYVASTDDNAIYAIHNAGRIHNGRGKGSLIYRDDVHLHGPLALVLAPNGDLITANGDAVNEDDAQPSELVEFTPHGRFVGQCSISPDPGGGLGIGVEVADGVLRFAAVNDNENTLNVWTFTTSQQEGGHDDPIGDRSSLRPDPDGALGTALASFGGERRMDAGKDVTALRDLWFLETGHDAHRPRPLDAVDLFALQ